MAHFGGGSPTGGLCYLSDGLPEKYHGKLVFSEWGKGALHVTEVARDGATSDPDAWVRFATRRMTHLHGDWGRIATALKDPADALTVVGADGAPRVVPKAEVKTKTDLHTSLMPPGLTMSLKPADFVDLLEYLESLRGQ